MACHGTGPVPAAVLPRLAATGPARSVCPAQGPCTGNDGGAGRVDGVVAHVSTPVYRRALRRAAAAGVGPQGRHLRHPRVGPGRRLHRRDGRPPALRRPDRQRVPRDRGHPGRAQVPQAAPRARRRRGRRGAGRLRGARPPAGPPPRAPGLRGGRRRLRRAHRPGPPHRCPGSPASRSASATSPPTCWPASPPSSWPPPSWWAPCPVPSSCSTCPTSPWRP